MDTITGLNAVFSGGAVTLTWSPIDDLSGYVVERKLSFETTYSLIGAVTDNYFNDSDVIRCLSYDYLVSPYTSCEIGTPASVNIILNAGTALEPVSGLTVTLNALIATLRWNVQLNVDHYVVQKKGPSDSVFVDIATINGRETTFVDPDALGCSTTYYYQLKAINFCSQSITPTSIMVSEENAPLPPSSNTLLTPHRNSVTIDVTAVAGRGALSYTLQRKSTGLYQTIDVETARSHFSYLDTGLDCGTQYVYKLIEDGTCGIISHEYYTTTSACDNSSSSSSSRSSSSSSSSSSLISSSSSSSPSSSSSSHSSSSSSSNSSSSSSNSSSSSSAGLINSCIHEFVAGYVCDGQYWETAYSGAICDDPDVYGFNYWYRVGDYGAVYYIQGGGCIFDENCVSPPYTPIPAAPTGWTPLCSSSSSSSSSQNLCLYTWYAGYTCGSGWEVWGGPTSCSPGGSVTVGWNATSPSSAVYYAYGATCVTSGTCGSVSPSPSVPSWEPSCSCVWTFSANWNCETVSWDVGYVGWSCEMVDGGWTFDAWIGSGPSYAMYIAGSGCATACPDYSGGLPSPPGSIGGPDCHHHGSSGVSVFDDGSSYYLRFELNSAADYGKDFTSAVVVCNEVPFTFDSKSEDGRSVIFTSPGFNENLTGLGWSATNWPLDGGDGPGDGSGVVGVVGGFGSLPPLIPPSHAKIPPRLQAIKQKTARMKSKLRIQNLSSSSSSECGCKRNKK